MTQVQPYVLRSWEKEFPGIGVQKADDTGRVYRQSDVDQVLRIKQLVFGEGLTLGGVRRRLEGTTPAVTEADEAIDVMEHVGADVRKRIGTVRDGLRALLQMLDGRPAPFALAPSAAMLAPTLTPATPSRGRALARRGSSPSRSKKVTAVQVKSTLRRKAAPKRKRQSA